MKKQFTTMLLSMLLGLSLASLGVSQDKMQKEMKKGEKMGMMNSGKEMSMGSLKSFSCDSACAFTIKSRDEHEITETAMKHMKKHHNMNATETEVKGMMKLETNGKMKE